MKYPHLLGLIACIALFVACENTKTAGAGNQERKRLAALRRQSQEQSQIDEAHANLWAAQQNFLNSDGNANRNR